MKEGEISLIHDTILFKGDDPYYEKLVSRPGKGGVWDLRGNLVENTCKV